MRAQVRTCVRAQLRSRVRACEGAHVRVGACVCALAGARNFFPINAPGMDRFKLFDLVGYS